MPAHGTTFRLLTPRAGTGGAASGAIAVIQIQSQSEQALTSALEDIGFGDLAIGAVSLRNLLEIDHGLVCRWSETCAQLMPHGGALIVRKIEQELLERGIAAEDENAAGSLECRYPEARDSIEACALEAISLARSAEAIDLILEHAGRARSGVRIDRSLGALGALIEPPIVACVGLANVGKSSLVNALASRDVSVVADVPGTTRDHVGVNLELAGLTVRWVDTPGVRTGADKIEQAAQEIVASVIGRAALIVLCGDAERGFVEPARAWRSVLRVGTKCDLAQRDGADIQTSAAEDHGLDELAMAIREAIVPARLLDSDGLWAFSEELERAVAG